MKLDLQCEKCGNPSVEDRKAKLICMNCGHIIPCCQPGEECAR